MVWEFPAVSHTRYDFWKAKQYTQSGMWWFTLVFGALGLHHYMLRSPQTGMIFFLTNILLCGYPWFYDLIQLSSYGESMEELNEFGLGHPWGPLGMAQGMWRRGDEKEETEGDDTAVITSTVAAITAAIGASQKGGALDAKTAAPAPANGTPANGTPANGTPANGTPANGTPANGTPANGTPANGTPANGTPANGTPAYGTPANGTNGKPANGTNGKPANGTPANGGKGCPKDEYTAPNPLLFILYNLCVPLSPLAHLIGGNRERAFTRFLYLFAGIIFALVFTVVFGILWFFLPSSASGLIYSLYPSALAIVSLAYLFAVIYDYLIMFFVPSSLFFNSKECNLNGFVGFKEDPPCPSTQDPMSVVTTVLKPATDIVYPILLSIYGAFKSVGNGIYAMTPMGRAEMMAKAAGGLPGVGALAGGLPGVGALAGGMPGLPPMPAMPAMPSAPAMPGMPAAPAVPGMPAAPAIPPMPPMPSAPGMPVPNTKPNMKGGAYIQNKELEPLDYLGGGVIGAVLLGGFILGAFRNVSRREYWLNDTPPNPRGV